nr:hypothetical protein [Candidatus Sigynarchaeota archaeon]
MKKKIKCSIILLITMLTVPLLSASLPASSDEFNGTGARSSQWVPKVPDNIAHTEDLDVFVLKDGSVIRMWDLLDNGANKIIFPGNESSPPNASTGVILDMVIRVAVVMHEKVPLEWGPITNYPLPGIADYIFNDDESIVSQIFVEVQALVNASSEVASARTVIRAYKDSLENVLSYGTTYQLYSNTDVGVGGGRRRLTMQFRAFPAIDRVKYALQYLFDNSLDAGDGLFQIDMNTFLNARHASIQISADWDNEWDGQWGENGVDDYWVNGVAEHNDYRWEYQAGIMEYQQGRISINPGGMNRLNFKDVIPYATPMGSSPGANESAFHITLYHGSEIVGARPNFINSNRERSKYNLDMLADSGEGANYQLPLDAHLNFTEGLVPAVVTVDVSANNYTLLPGNDVSLTYNVTNHGPGSIYDVDFVDGFLFLPGGFAITQGDNNTNGNIDYFWNQISAGTSVSCSATIHCNPAANGSYFACFPEVRYDPSTFTDTSEWLANPIIYDDSYEIDGAVVIITCNVTSPLLKTWARIADESVDVGDSVNVSMTVKNVGNANATNF